MIRHHFKISQAAVKDPFSFYGCRDSFCGQTSNRFSRSISKALSQELHHAFELLANYPDVPEYQIIDDTGAHWVVVRMNPDPKLQVM